MRGTAKIALAVAVVGSVPLVSMAAPATNLAELRSQVDAAAEALEVERASARDELAALRAERAELERQVRAEASRRATLNKLRAEATARAEQADADAGRWHAPTLAAIEVAREHVERSLPFARTERGEVLDRIERDLAAATPDHARAVERLLRFIEEEEAMGRELALTQQQIALDGEPQLVDVVRLGMALLYFRTRDDRYGWARPTDDGFVFEVLDDPELALAVRRRFEAHERADALGRADLVLPSTVPEEAGKP
jgi:hypothetical protein